LTKPIIENPDRSFAIVTPSYVPDLARCELLAESLDRTAADAPHYLIVDRHDYPAFRHLNGGRRRLIEAEALVGSRFWRMPGRKPYWLSAKALPVRGWIMQQILKIAATEAIPERTLIICDSDDAFFRHFDRDDILIGSRVGLFDDTFVNDELRRWTATARRLLGLAPHEGGYRNYVSQMICWNRETVKALQQRIEISTGMNWQVALARTLSFSEYMLYGIFVREVLGYENTDHTPSAAPLVKTSWGSDLSTDFAIDTFFADFDPKTVAIMVNSKDGIDPARYRHHLERLWKETEESESMRQRSASETAS
jgi:hypothetical protein